MPKNKNQHYVPQVYLRSFSCDTDGEERKRTNCFLIKAEKFLKGVSIRDQCSKAFFYGKEEIFDDFTKIFEGGHGQTMRALRNFGNGEPVYLNRLTRFFLLQYLRTPHMLEQRRYMREQAEGMVFGDARLEISEFKDEREMQHQLYIAAKETDILDDLEVVLIRNRTKVPFITADNPAICLNRLHSQRFGDHTSGLITSGLLAVMPLDPVWSYFAYDREVYSVAHKESVMELRNENDVHRLNQLQAIMAINCLYFADISAVPHVLRAVRDATPRRRESWNEFWEGILVDEDQQVEIYRRATPEDRAIKTDRILSWSPVMPTPHTWPTFIKYKLRPKGCDTGAAAGFIRPAAAKKEKYRKPPLVPIPSTMDPNRNPSTRDFSFVAKRLG